MTNVHDILEKVRAAGQRLPPNEAAVLFAAVVRLAAAQGATLRGRLVQIDEAGALHLAAFDDQAPETEPGYLAPELLAKDAPRKSEPRVQVYAAGALGYEVLTGQRPPSPEQGPGPELAGPLGDIIRMALVADRRERFGDLTQLQDAVEGVQPRPPGQGERNILSALRTRWTRAPIEKEALAKLIEKLGALEAQVALLGKAQAKIQAGQQQTLERIERFEDGQQRLGQGPRKQASGVGPALLAGVLAAAAVVGVGWATGMVGPPGTLRSWPAVREDPVPARAAAEKTAPPPHAPVPAEAVPDAALAAEKPSSDAAGLAAAPLAAQPDASVAAAAPDAGATQAVAPTPPEPAPPAAKPEPRRRRSAEVSQAAMLHAVAISQVRRGEAALEHGRADEALESFRTALENEPTMAVAFRGMGMAYATLGNDAQALQAYEKYLQLAPRAADAGDIRRSIKELKARAKIGSGEK
jgi:tetratricopeptide (TPR) repeat protein